MQKQKFTQKGLKELIARSTAFSYMFGDDSEFFAEIILGMGEAEQKKIFEILEEEKVKMGKIDEKYAKKELNLYESYSAKMKGAKVKFVNYARKGKEEFAKAQENENTENLLKELE
ncbi:MAG: hypothetical protein ABH856_02120 [Patescibacteria group bacterium]